MPTFVLKKGFVVVSAAPEGGGRIVHQRTGDSLELTPDEALTLVRAGIGGLDGDDPELRTLVRKFSDLGLIVERPEPASATVAAAAPAEGNPTFRKDLSIVQRGTTAVFDVTNPDSTRTFQLYDFELSLARALDGTKTPAEVLAAARARGIPVTEQSMASFVRQMKAYGFLEKPAPAPVAVVEPAAPEPKPGVDPVAELSLEVGPDDFDLPTVDPSPRPEEPRPAISPPRLPSVAPTVAPVAAEPEETIDLPLAESAPAPVQPAPVVEVPPEPAATVPEPEVELEPVEVEVPPIEVEVPPAEVPAFESLAAMTPAPVSPQTPAVLGEAVITGNLEPVPDNSSEVQVSTDAVPATATDPLEAPRPFSIQFPLGAMPPANATQADVETVQRPAIIRPAAQAPEPEVEAAPTEEKPSSAAPLLYVVGGLAALVLGVVAYFAFKPPASSPTPAPVPVVRAPVTPPTPVVAPVAAAEPDAGEEEAEITVDAPVVTVDAGAVDVAVVEKPAPAPAPEGGWAEFKVARFGRVKMAEVVAPAAGEVKWKVKAEQLVKRNDTVATLVAADGTETRLTAKQAGHVIPMPGVGEHATEKQVLAGILYFEAYLITDVTDVTPASNWRCEVASASAGQSAPCKVVQAVKKGGALQVTSTAEPRWLDAANDLVVRFAPP